MKSRDSNICLRSRHMYFLYLIFDLDLYIIIDNSWGYHKNISTGHLDPYINSGCTNWTKIIVQLLRSQYAHGTI